MKLIHLILAVLAVGFTNAEGECEEHCCAVIASSPDASMDAINVFWEEQNCTSVCGADDYQSSVCADASTRSGDITSYYMQQLSQGGVLPGQLSLLANAGSGQSTKDMIKSQLLAQIGLPIELVHLILNNGQFSSDSGANQNAMIKFLATSGSIPAILVPFLLKADNAKEFYIFSMLESGDIDPLMGLLTLSQTSSAFDKDTILQLIVQAALEGRTDDLLYGITTPYVPELPQGIFPGSDLYMAHFEGLGVSTCALHDLRNRFECGYVGIAAADCEFLPYCCYSPVFMTDTQVSESTEGALVSASEVPWCYYNVFFVYHDQFALTVKQIGEFAAPLQCPPLWKYDLGLDGSLASLISGTSSLSKLANAREECGFPGITEFQCVAIRGCCWDDESPIGQTQCFKPKDIPSFNPAMIPDAYQPVAGVCDVNKHKIPMLYYQRKAATYPLVYHKYGTYNIFQEPSRIDCLTKLGACYEEDDEVAAKYPKVPRCYQRTSGVAPVDPIGSVIQRSGADGFKDFPPASSR